MMGRASKVPKKPEQPITIVHTLVIKFNQDAIKQLLMEAACKALPVGVGPEAFDGGVVELHFDGCEDDIELAGASVRFDQKAKEPADGG